MPDSVSTLRWGAMEGLGGAMEGLAMRAIFAVLGLIVALTSGAVAENASSKVSAPDAKSKATLGRSGDNTPQQAGSKARAPAVGHDGDATVDLEALKASKPEGNAKFGAAAKIGAKAGPALMAARAAGSGESPKLAPTASKSLMNAAPAIARAERDPDAINATFKVR
jgi:hypothetical protein